MSESRSTAKPFVISKEMVWDAYESVKANHGAPGVDEESIAEFEAGLKGNLYKLWNRLSSGSYFPQPVRAVAIPKKDGDGSRLFGVPTVSDRIAQTVAKMALEAKVEPLFHPDSYGYRPGRSALDAVEVCRLRCWKDLVGCRSRHSGVLRHRRSRSRSQGGSAAHRPTLDPALRGSVAQRADAVRGRDRGATRSWDPAGVGDLTVAGEPVHALRVRRLDGTQVPTVRFERYCDDVVVHCTSERQAQFVIDSIAGGLAECGLELHPGKTRIVYCTDSNRSGSYEQQRFDFLGYTFRPRLSVSKTGERFVSFSPAVSRDAQKAMGKTIRAWRINRRSDRTLEEFAAMVNPVVRGWINYYGRFYRSELKPILRRINAYLIRWAMNKYKRLRTSRRRARRWLVAVHQRQPDLFHHWRVGARPDGWTVGAV